MILWIVHYCAMKNVAQDSRWYYGVVHDDVRRCDAGIIVSFRACFKECDRLFGYFRHIGAKRERTG